MTRFLTGNEWNWRLLRIIAQGVLGLFVANIDMIIGAEVLDPAMRALVVAFMMSVLSPITAEIGAHLPEGE